MACTIAMTGCSLIDALGESSSATHDDAGNGDGGGDAGPPLGDTVCTRVSYAAPTAPITPITMTDVDVIDVNNDGHPDLVTGGAGQLGIVLGKSDGTGITSTYNQILTLPAGLVTEHLAVGDFNGDGFGDAVASFKPQLMDSPQMAFGSAAGMFGTSFQVLAGGSQHGLVVGDFTPAGVAQDLITVRADMLIVWQWNGASLEMANAVTLPGSPPIWRATRGKFDAGASDDLAIGSAEVGIVIIEQPQPGNLIMRTIPGTAGGPAKLALAAGNFDGSGGDELVEVIGLGTAERDVIVRANGGRGPVSNLLSSMFFPANVATGDVDRDGNLDVVTSGLSGKVLVFFGDGAGGFPCHQEVTLQTDPGWVALGSFTIDERLELVTTSSQGLSWILSNP